MKPGKPKLRQSTLNFSSKTGSLSYSVKSPKEPLANNSSSNSSFCLASQLSSNNSSLSFDESQNGGLNNIQMSPGQRRLNDLKGVWIIKQIDQYKEKLNDPAVSSEEKIDIVLRLLDKSPSTEMIQSSGIGAIIKNLAKSRHDQENIQSVTLVKESMKLYRHWKRLVQKREDLNLVARMKNLNTTERQNQVKKLVEACSACIYKDIRGYKDKDIANELKFLNSFANYIENYVFNISGNFIGSYYRRLIQDMTSDITENKFGWCQKILLLNEKFRASETSKNAIDKLAIVSELVKEQLDKNIKCKEASNPDNDEPSNNMEQVVNHERSKVVSRDDACKPHIKREDLVIATVRGRKPWPAIVDDVLENGDCKVTFFGTRNVNYKGGKVFPTKIVKYSSDTNEVLSKNKSDKMKQAIAELSVELQRRKV